MMWKIICEQLKFLKNCMGFLSHLALWDLFGKLHPDTSNVSSFIIEQVMRLLIGKTDKDEKIVSRS